MEFASNTSVNIVKEETLKRWSLWRKRADESDLEGLRSRIFEAVHKKQIEEQGRPNSIVVTVQNSHRMRYNCCVDRKMQMKDDEELNKNDQNLEKPEGKVKRLCSFILRAQYVYEGAIIKEYNPIHSCDGHSVRQRKRVFEKVVRKKRGKSGTTLSPVIETSS